MELWILLTVAAVALNYHLATKKGMSVPVWVVLGVLFGFFSSIFAAIMPGDPTMAGNVKCGHCAEWIRGEAKVCRHCGRERTTA